jgi:DNA uptake protein ComE-like DNA-binding protein
MNASVEELIAVEGIGMVSAKAIRGVLDAETF